MITNLLDLRFAGRMLRKNPGHTVSAIIALGLGIGLTTTVFSMVWGALVRGLPFDDPQEIVHLESNNPEKDQESLEAYFLDYLAWRERQTAFEGLAAFYQGTINLSGDERPERFNGAFLTANAFDLLGVKPALGRGFLPGEDRPGAEPVVLLGYEVWQTRYGGDPGVVGRSMRMNGQPATIVGVMPDGFGFPISEEVWTTLRFDPAEMRRDEESRTVEVYGRLREGVGIEAARSEMSTIAKALALEFPETNKGRGAVVKPYTEEYVGDDVSSLLFVMLAAVVCVLLMACANVANLMLARAAKRTRELAVRSALGAGRRSLIAQILLESWAIAALGALLGIALATWGIAAFNRAIVDTTPPFWLHFEIDTAALVFTLLATLLSGTVSGLLPALRASRANLSEVLKDEGRGSTSLKLGRMGKGIVVLEVALSCVLLVMAGLMVKSVVKLRTIDLGFEADHLLTARIALFDASYPDDAAKAAFFQGLLDRLDGQAGVSGVAIASNLPLGSGMDHYALEGKAYPKAEDLPLAHTTVVSPGFFALLEAEVLAGREFTGLDNDDGLPVALVNKSFAEKAWPGQDPVGQRVRVGREADAPWRTVVGVVADLNDDGIDFGDSGEERTPEGFYLPLSQAPRGFMSVILRTPGDPLAAAPAVRRAVGGLDPDLPIYFVFTMQQVIAENTFFPRLFGTLFLLFGVVALLLAAVGIYGVLAFSVRQRTQEIGVRMALGAGRERVLGLILKQGSAQLAIGLAIGLVLAWLGAKPLARFLYQIQPSDPPVFIGTVLFLTLVSLVACWVPARRAARVDPMVAFRAD